MRESKLLVENFSSQTENAGYVSRAELSCEQTTRGGIGEGGNYESLFVFAEDV